MNCKLFFCLLLGNKKFKMNNWFIPPNGIGELYLDVTDMHWYSYESFYYNFHKEIPFAKLILNMASLQMRYLTQLNGNCLLMPQTIPNLGNTSAMLTNSFIKIQSLSEDLFCTGDIETLRYCMEVYNQFLNKKPLDFFVSGCWKIEKFLVELEKVFLLNGLIPNKSKF